jgi:opacity protein-like surface antigen
LEDVAGESLEVDHEIHSAMLNLRFRPAARVARARTGAAERRQGWYLHSNAGMSFAKDAEIKDNLANFDAFDIGTVAAVALGRTVAERWRIELEGARRSNEVELIDFNPEFGEERAEGRVAVRSVMANLAYEPDWNTAFRPYAGLGVGMAWSKWDVRLEADNSTYVDDQDSAPAFQVMFGAAADLTERLEATAEYRYWMTGLFDLAEPDGRPMRTEHTVHSVMFGLRYTLR